MTTSTSDREITGVKLVGVTGPDAAELAGITYRQLDHWARQGWITPSVEAGTGRGGTRVYSAVDVLRLAVLRHLGQSGWALKALGPGIGELDLDTCRWVVVAHDGEVVAVAAEEELLEVVTRPGRHSVFDLEPLRQQLTGPDPVEQPTGIHSLRRSA